MSERDLTGLFDELEKEREVDGPIRGHNLDQCPNCGAHKFLCCKLMWSIRCAYCKSILRGKGVRP